MRIHEALVDAATLISSWRQAAHSAGRVEEERLWLYLCALSDFVRVTGQVYRFEDSLKAAVSSEPHHISARLGEYGEMFAQRAVELLLEILDQVKGPEQRQRVPLLVALVHFIADTGQMTEAESFFINWQEYAPVAIAHFASREQAEEWLRGVAEPPSPAYILVGDEYYQF